MSLVEYLESYIVSDNPVIFAVTFAVIAFCVVEIVGIMFSAVFSFFKR